jgi:hypothetical protein
VPFVSVVFLALSMVYTISKTAMKLSRSIVEERESFS